jgi:hypothetical protein
LFSTKFCFEHHIPDKVEERTRRKGTKEKGKSRGAPLYDHKGYNFSFENSCVYVYINTYIHTDLLSQLVLVFV